MTEKTDNQRPSRDEKYEGPEVVKMGLVIDLTKGGGGSAADSNSTTIPVQK